jgi:hypothetical protein
VGDDLRSIFVGTAGLSVAAAVAVYLALSRGRPPCDLAGIRVAVRAAALATGLQAAHFVEELATGFHRRFPIELGLAPWPASFFLSFNLFWLVVWAVSGRRLPGRHAAALAALWFLGLAGVINAAAHPLLAVRAGGYFPGLVTAPLAGVAGFLLLRRLAAITRSAGADSPAERSQRIDANRPARRDERG